MFKKLRIIILFSICLAIFWSIVHAQETITLKCEQAIINATEVGWKYTNTNNEFKKMIIADNNITKQCKGN